MREGYITEKEVLEKLNISKEDLEKLIGQDKLTPEPEEGEEGQRTFSGRQVEAIISEQKSDDFDLEDADVLEEEDSGEEDILFDLDATDEEEEEEGGEDIEAEAPADETGKSSGESDSDGELFDLDDDLDSEVPALDNSGSEHDEEQPEEEDSGLDEFDFLLEDEESDEGTKTALTDEDEDEEIEEEEEDFLLTEDIADDDDEKEEEEEEDGDSGDIITEVVDVSELEDGEGDILSDVIEDSSGEVSSAELKAAKSAQKSDSSTQEPTVDMTELDDETDLLDSEEPTSDITQLEDDFFEDESESATEVVSEETDFDEDDVIEYGEALAAKEAPFPTWAVIVLTFVLIIQLVAIIYIVENTLQPGEPTNLSQVFNLARFF